jgi:ubiquinone/menaquinone biosynthesis C-methylase UbiE
MSDDRMAAEAARIRAEYERREREIGRDFYALTDSTNLYMRQGQQRALLRALAKIGKLPLAARRILDVGCGRGGWLATFEDFGATRASLAGTDLDADRIADAKQRFGGADLRVGDATHLPWPDGSFEIVLQATVFTSILDDAVRRAVASEMQRVLATSGVIIWYDFRVNNPKNRNVRGVSAKEIRALFPRFDVSLEPVTLAPPIARRLVPRSRLAAEALERLTFLNTHYLGILRAR